VGLRHFRNKARRSFWSLHIEAWRRSGVSRAAYCRDNRLSLGTFGRWLKALDALELARIRARELRKRTHEPISKDRHNKAVQAFWAMHVEALNWSGLTAKAYAEAHRISINSLRTWRARLDADPMQIDWRARLHPSVPARISSGASSAANEQLAKNDLTDGATAPPAHDGRSNRRSFTDLEKLAIVMEAEQPGVSAAAVCRRHNIATSMIFRWRIQFGVRQREQAELAAVRVSDGRCAGGPVAAVETIDLQNLLPAPDGMELVELADGRKVFAPIGSDRDAVRKHIAERENT
jgi:transposase-like protein